MNITLNCKISLSKKLRAIMGKGGTILLQTSSLDDGKGEGRLSFISDSAPEMTELTDDLKTETSIMLTPVSIADDVPDSDSSMCASIFSTGGLDDKKDPIVKKIGVVTPPDKGKESRAFKEKADVPKQFDTIKNSECRKWVQNMSELIEAINAAKSKKSSIDLNAAQSDRERAVLLEMKEKEEAIDIPAWIVNESAGQMTINDLNISLPFKSPFDLSNLSSKRIAASKDLKGLLNAGLIKFISPSDIKKYLKDDDEEERDNSLEVFDRHEDVEHSIKYGDGKKTISREDLVEVDEVADENADELTEDEQMIINLTKNSPKVKAVNTLPEGTKHTVHGNSSPRQPDSESRVKPIRKIER